MTKLAGGGVGMSRMVMESCIGSFERLNLSMETHGPIPSVRVGRRRQVASGTGEDERCRKSSPRVNWCPRESLL